MRIAAFNGFGFHDEIFGSIINFCYSQRHELTIFCRIENYNSYMEFYKMHFNNYRFDILDCRIFPCYKYNYDTIFLITDDDINFPDNDHYINNKTIRIDHNYEIRRETIPKYIAVRPFETNNRNWALPCFPLLYSTLKKRILSENNIINITILGSNYGQYNVSILNRIYVPEGSRIKINAMAREIGVSNFYGLDMRKFDLYIYKNLNTICMMNVLKQSDYVITDISNEPKYENEMMAGAIPLAISSLSPLIISQQSNVFYKFENVITFDKNSTDPIILEPVNISALEIEREKFIMMLPYHFSAFCNSSSM